MMTGYWAAQALYVAAKLSVADLLAHGPVSVTGLAAATHTDASERTFGAFFVPGCHLVTAGRCGRANGRSCCPTMRRFRPSHSLVHAFQQ